ncbi:hypothetical protein [Streptomyces oceani]|uniref:Uncharacterized protein n=1 Tax=Streptomyces oceani TaxID=1075402 RepID=A0A1E7JZ58_9ACTN|nr:hypothetical protein [Streptomyces oceani]OEU96895.1 hypothetical protein AN216_18245 [Streptomyces oceani]
MTDTAQAEDNGPDRPAPSGSRRDERRTVRLANRIGAFAQAHGGKAQGQIAYLGQRGVRLVLVAEDGTWGDQVAPSRAMAEQAAERAGVTLHDTLDGELAGRMRTGPYEWSRMAGIQLGGGTAGN